jgi:putative ABC transport system permease protein
MSSITSRKVVRSLLGNKSLLLINIAGLAIGILSLGYSALYIIHEIKVDQYNLNYNRIYRILQTWGTNINGSSPFAVKPLLGNIPEIEASARFIKSDVEIEKNGEQILESNLKYVDKEIFNIYSFPVIYGNIKNFLTEPNSIVLTQEVSERYFGNINPVGESLTIRLNNKYFILKIDGVIKNLPDYSSFQAKMFVDFDMYSKRFNNEAYKTDWVDWGFTTIILVKSNIDKNTFERKFKEYFEKYFIKYPNVKYSLQPLSSIYFNSGHLGNNKFNEGNMNKLILLGSISLIIFIISFINFTLLSIARKYSNLKEVGIIKVLGASRWDYIKIISVESLIIAFITLILTNIFLIFILKEINQLLNVNFTFNIKESISFYVTCLIITFIASFISGLYIATVLYRLNPLSIFRQNAKSNLTKNPFIITLIISQLTSICILIGVTFSFNSQLSRIFHYNMGYDNSNLTVIDIGLKEKKINYNILLSLLRQYPGVLNATASDNSIHALGRQFRRIEIKQGIDPVEVDYMNVESNYLQTLKLTLKDGRYFMPGDSNSMIINESFAKLFPSNPIGETMVKKTVIGIVKDFHFRSFYKPITPLTIESSPKEIYQILIRMVSPITTKTNSDIKKIINGSNPGLNFKIYDYDSKLQATYADEFKLKAIFTLFIIMSLILVFSGLLGFSFYITQSKTKEICIRKIHGAGTISILWIISKDFLPLVVISNVLALPFAYYVINEILIQFTVKVPFDFGIYFITFLSTCFFVLLILFLRTTFVLKQNVVQYIKYE